MKRIKLLLVNVLLTVLVLAGCSAVTYDYTSSPESGRLETSLFEATFTPEKDDANYFAWFKLEISNLSGEPFEIDWNQTRYLLDGKNRGGFAFEGIVPATIKDGTIPNEVIAPGQKFLKQISPVAKIAMAERKDYSAGKEKPGIYSGILPAGENGIVLAIQTNGQLVRKKLVVVITEEKKNN